MEADLSGDISRFFHIRKKWEDHEYVIPVTADLEFLSEGRRRFHGEQIESLYESWRSHELNESELRAKISQQKPERAVFFDTFLIKGTPCSGTEFAEPGDRCMKDKDQPSAHRVVHPAEEESVEEF